MRPDQHTDYIVQCIREAGSMYEDDAREFLAEHDVHVRAEVLNEAANFVGNDDDCECGGCDTCIPRKLADGLRQMAREKSSRETAAEATSALTVYRASHDSIVMGLYTTREAAQAHCEAKVQQEEPAGSIRHLSWSADDIGDDAEYELHITPAETGELIRGTGYVVTPLEVASAYDPDGDE
ncbi:hypothetical protein ACWC3Y_11195 [Streptomyces sp. NPDC001296]